MKRLWTLDDIKGFIKRYGVDESKVKTLIKNTTPRVYYISMTFQKMNSSTFDGRYCETITAYVNKSTYESFNTMISDAQVLSNPFPTIAKWLSSHTEVNFQCKGLLAKGESLIPQVIFANADNTDVTIGCIDISTYEYTTANASQYFDSVYAASNVVNWSD